MPDATPTESQLQLDQPIKMGRPVLARVARRGDGRGPCPRRGSTCSRREKRQTSPSRTPKGANHGLPSLFPCKKAASRGPRKGAICRSRTPLLGTLAQLVPPRLVAEGHAPLGQYFSRCAKEPDESIPDPKGANRGPPPGFHLQTGISESRGRGQ
jgi:hypothetical protein